MCWEGDLCNKDWSGDTGPSVTETNKEPTTDEHADILRCGLDHAADDCDYKGQQYAPSAFYSLILPMKSVHRLPSRSLRIGATGRATIVPMFCTSTWSVRELSN